jgi:hypothetical protein
MDRAGFIDEPKTSSSLRKIGLTFSLVELLFVFTILVADKCRDIQGYWSKGTLTVYKGYTAYRGYVAYLYG